MVTAFATGKASGHQKAATLLIALGPELSAKVLKNFPEAEIEQLTLEVFRLERVNEETKDSVLEECHNMAVARNFITTGGAEFAREMLEHALGKPHADEVMTRLSAVPRLRPFDFLRETDPTQLATFIQAEHPQTIALILSHVTPVRAAEVLASLDPGLQSEVAMRVASMDRTPPEVVEQVADILKTKLSKVVTSELRSAGGVEFLVKVLTNSDRSTEKLILDNLDEINPELAADVRKLMFVFDNIIQLDDRSMQRVLREVDAKDLALALKNAAEDLRNHFLHNLSSRAAEMLKEEMDVSGPVRLKQVQEAQQRVVNVVRRLDEAGEIVIQRGGDDVLV